MQKNRLHLLRFGYTIYFCLNEIKRWLIFSYFLGHQRGPCGKHCNHRLISFECASYSFGTNAICQSFGNAMRGASFIRVAARRSRASRADTICNDLG